MSSGIYQIRNLVNAKIYIGSSVNVDNRWRQHRQDLNKGAHKNRHLQAAWDKYGLENFVFEVVEICDEETLVSTEQRWLDETKCFDNSIGYNISHSSENSRGVKRSEETKEKISRAKKGQIPWNKGQKGCFKHTEKWRKEQSCRLKGKNLGEAQGSARLNGKLVEQIREEYSVGDVSQYDLAQKYGVSRGCIQGVITGKNWKEFQNLPIIRKQVKYALCGQDNPMYGKKFDGTIGNFKLTWEKVREIRERYADGACSQRQLAKEYAVGQRAIFCIVNFITWKEPAP